jgi:hypothetical protein
MREMVMNFETHASNMSALRALCGQGCPRS